MQQRTYHAAPALPAGDQLRVLERRLRRRTVAGAFMLAAGGVLLGILVLVGLMIGMTQATGLGTMAEVVQVRAVDGNEGLWTTEIDGRFTTDSGQEVTTWFVLDGRYGVGDTFGIVYLPWAPEASAASPGELGYTWLGIATGVAVAIPLVVAGVLLVLVTRRRARPIRSVLAGGSRTPGRMWALGPSSVRLEPVGHPEAPALAVHLLAPLPALPPGPVDVVVIARPEQGMLVVVQLPDGRLLLPKGPATALPRAAQPAPAPAVAP